MMISKILVGKPERKRSLGSHERRWKSNIKMDLEEVRCECVDLIQFGGHNGDML
jgi:hypothetical protein